MNECAKKCLRKNKACKKEECRMWLDYKQDLNCTLIAVNNSKEMTLQEVSNRLNISVGRVKQIQDKALQKLRKKRHLKAF